jgi:magnesium transporter
VLVVLSPCRTPATGIISSDQNHVIKVLTIASVVGIQPVLVAGIYGMNFKNIPEHDWAWGYQGVWR